MPFDFSNQSSPDREIISSLVQQADEAWEAQDRAACIDLIEHIYLMLDVSSNAYIVEPSQLEYRTAHRVCDVVSRC